MAPPRLDRWARDWDRCRRCHRRKFSHHARGLCRSCYTYTLHVRPAREAARLAREKSH